MLLSILTLFALAPLALPLARHLPRACGWLLGASVVVVGAVLLLRAGLGGEPSILAQSPTLGLVEAYTWVPSLSLTFQLRLDGLAAVFVLLITGVGALVIVHAGDYLRGDLGIGRLLALLVFFIAAMLGLVLSDNLIALFIFWELTSVASYFLIGFNAAQASARSAARKALLTTGAGGVVMLVGFVVLHTIGRDLGLSASEAWQLSALNHVAITEHPAYAAAFFLLLAGAATKSAQVPFHFWLPGAMAAPTPVSALLHSATMVKAGVFLLARLHPGMGGTVLWEASLTVLGGSTMLFAAVLTLGQRDVKRVLAFSTVAVLGILVLLLGLGTRQAVEAFVVFLVAHAFYKAALFMIAANIDHGTGTRDLTQLSGLWRAMPVTAAAGVLAALSKAGAPPMFGFIGKELLYQSKLDLASGAAWLVLAAVVTNVLLVASALLAGVRPFFGRQKATPRVPHEAPWGMRLGPLVLGLSSLFVALMPGWFDRTLASPMASAVLGQAVQMELALWHGLNPAALAVLALSLLTLAAGAGTFWWVRRRLRFTQRHSRRLARLGVSYHFDDLLQHIYRVAGWFTARVHGGGLRRSLWLTLLSGLVLVGLSVPWRVPAASITMPPLAVIALGLMVGGALLASLTLSRLTAVVGLGVTGLALALVFVLFGAPDLAITQIMVETLTVVMLMLLLRRMRPMQRATQRSRRLLDLVPAVACGALAMVLVLAAGSVVPDDTVSRWLAGNSASLALGRNVVNVILVDFRAFDTLGEITVVATAVLGVMALLERRRPSKDGA